MSCVGGAQIQIRPVEYHGRRLNYFTLPVVWMSGAKSYVETTRGDLSNRDGAVRVGLILPAATDWDGLGWAESLCAGALIAISPAMSFYARYYIHEMRRWCFSYFWPSPARGELAKRRKRWAYLCGNCIGAGVRNEGNVGIESAAMGVGIGFALLWTKMVDARRRR